MSGMSPTASHIRLRSVRYACPRRPLDPTGFPGPPAGRGSYATTYLGTVGRGTLRVPRAAGRPMEPLVDALLQLAKAHLAVLTQRGLRAGSGTWEPRSTSGRIDQTGSTGWERLRESCMLSERPHGHSHDQ
jgi:hypothetical protein